MIKILVINDETALCDIIENSFQGIGYTTFKALNGASGLETARAENPDIVFLDPDLPDLKGADILPQIKEIDANALVFITTDKSNAKDKDTYLQLGALDVVSKPFGRQHMRDLIATNIHLIRQKNSKTETPSLLIVDDEESICFSLKQYLSNRLKINTTICFSGEQALEILQKSHFDIALIDVTMSGINGLEVIEKVKKKTKDTEFIVMTGWKSSEVAQQAQKKGISYYLTKPLDMEGLFKCMRIILAEKNKLILKDLKR